MHTDSTQTIFIFDLDGTLADTRHRVHLIKDKTDPNRWDDFSKACVYDPPIIGTVLIFNALLSKGYDIRIFTGRSDLVREDTITWLYKNTVLTLAQAQSIITMRKHGDHTPDTKLKLAWYRLMSAEERKNISAVFEDRYSVVQMWRDQGLLCHHVDRGDF